MWWELKCVLSPCLIPFCARTEPEAGAGHSGQWAIVGVQFGGANIWQGWGQVLHSFAPPPANTNTALSSEDPHFWRGHRRFCGHSKSSSFIFGECQPQIVTRIANFRKNWAYNGPTYHNTNTLMQQYTADSDSALSWCWILFLWWATPTTCWLLCCGEIRHQNSSSLFS